MYYITPYIPIPPPLLNVLIKPNSSLTLRGNEEKDIALSINSTTNLHPIIDIVVNKPRDVQDVEIDAHPNHIPFDGLAESQLHVKVSGDAKERTLLIPITVKMGFQGSELTQTYAASKETILALSILPKLNLWDYFNSYLNSLGPIIKELIALITAISGIAGSLIFLLLRFSKKIRKRKNTENSKR